MSVYFYAPPSQTTVTTDIPPIPSPSHEKIGALFYQIVALPHPDHPKLPELFSHLGIHPEDHSARISMYHLLRRLTHASITVKPADEARGMFYINHQGAPLAVFKTGRKRAAMELAMRQLAHFLGLAQHIIPGSFCALHNPPMDLQDEEPCVEELWNGHLKQFLSPQQPCFVEESDDDEEDIVFSYEEETLSENPTPNACAQEALQPDSTGCTPRASPTQQGSDSVLVGILEPHILPNTRDLSPCALTTLTLLVLAGGMRDIKQDGMGFDPKSQSPMLFDTEDNSPTRIDPPSNWDTPCSTQCSYLDHTPNRSICISDAELHALQDLVNRWDIDAIVSQMGRLPVLFPDPIGEKSRLGMQGVDEGGCPFQIINMAAHAINGPLVIKIDGPVLTPTQLEALRLRLTRLKERVSQGPFSAEDLVRSVDPHYAALVDRMTTSPQCDTIARIGAHSALALHSPSELGIQRPPPFMRVIAENTYTQTTSTVGQGTELKAAENQ